MTEAELFGYRQLESQTLAQLEAVIEGGLRTFVEVGEALLEIRNRRLYREQGFKTFEEYCLERWRWRRDYANKQIRAAEVVRNLDTTVSKPESEWQARPLTNLPPEDQREVWSEAVSNGQVSKRTSPGGPDDRAGTEKPPQPASRYRGTAMSDLWRHYAKRAATMLTVAAEQPAEERAESLQLMYDTVVELTRSINSLETQDADQR